MTIKLSQSIRETSQFFSQAFDDYLIIVDEKICMCVVGMAYWYATGLFPLQPEIYGEETVFQYVRRYYQVPADLLLYILECNDMYWSIPAIVHELERRGF